VVAHGMFDVALVYGLAQILVAAEHGFAGV